MTRSMKTFLEWTGRAGLATAAVLIATGALAQQAGQAQTYTVLYTFTGGADGGTPMSTPTLLNGNVYGTTSGGGAHASGTVYELNFKSRKETALHSFNGGDGIGPIGGLVMGPNGNFYGVAYRGGSHNDGTLYE